MSGTQKAGFWGAALAFAVILVLGASRAHAQKAPPPDPSTFNDVQFIVTPRLAIEQAYRLRTAVNRAAARSLARAKAGPETPAGTAPSPMLFAGSGEESASSDPAWTAWVDGTHSDIKDSNPVSGYDGPQNSVIAAVERQLSDNAVAGLLYNYSDSDVTNLFQPGGSETEAHGVGVYIGLFLTDTLVFDAAFLANGTDNSCRDATATARYDSDGWIASANLTGYYYFNNLRVSPGAGVSLTRVEDDAYIDSSGTGFTALNTRTGTANISTTLGYTIELDDNRSVEPFVTLEGEWEFQNSTTPSTAIASVPVSSLDWNLRASAGIDVALPGDKYLTIQGDFGGLNDSQFRSYAINGKFSVPFNGP
ncbi:MAG: autotransporter outer membrane beta-barrel domain-containing protein [Methyloligellaceae bacterium]